VARFLKKLFRRALIWFVSLCVAFYVPLAEAGMPYPLDEWEEKILHAGRFSDVFLATVAMVVLSASGLADNIIANKSGNTDWITTGSAWTFMVIYFLFVFFGMPAYSGHVGMVEPNAAPWKVLWGLLVVGMFGELIIASIPD
jgi:hypothetical protein